MLLSRLILAALLLIALQAESRSDAGAGCPKTAGFVGGPFVPTEDVARDIYRAVAGAIAPGSFDEFPVINVSDEGDHWIASQDRAQPTEGFGGGQLHMNIDKCTGAISRAAFNK